MKRLIPLLIILLLNTQCAWFSKKFGGKRDSDLVETFDIQEEQFEQYKISPQIVDMPEEEEIEEIESKKEPTLSPKPKSAAPLPPLAPKNRTKKEPKKSSKAALKQKPTPSPSPEIEGVVDQGAKEKITIYPEDYPTLYKEYDQVSKSVWKQYRPKIFVGERIVIRLSYLGVKAGTVSMVVRPHEQIANHTAYYLSARLKSAKFYSYIYKLDDSLHTFVDSESFLPIKYSLMQRESGQSVDDLQLFDRKGLKTHFWYKRIKNEKTKQEKKSAYIPQYALDSFSALYFIRGLPLKDGDLYQIPIITRTKVWIMKVKVEQREQIEVNGERHQAIRINAITHYPGVLKRRGNITFWFADNEHRGFLKFRAKIKIGSVRGERIKLYR
jgi:hypothetical protein